MTDLVSIDITPIKLFSENGLEPILFEIKKKVDEFEPDVETGTGRKEIASFAYKIAQSKTFIEKAGKELVAKQKAAIKLIDTERKRSRDFLDEQRDRARQPLTEWEEAEKKALEEEEKIIRFEADHTEGLEFHALWLKDKELEALKAKIAREVEEKRQKEEAARIEQDRIEREERLKKEAAEKAKKHAEDAAERKIKEAKEAVEKAEWDKITAKEKAEREKQEAIDKTKREAEEKAAKIEAARFVEENEERAKIEADLLAAKRRAAHKSHQRRINREILEGFQSIGIIEDEGKLIVEAIVKKQIPHIEIKY